jgi:hypothetical protein
MLRAPLVIASLALALVGAAIIAVIADTAAQFHPKYWIGDRSTQVSAAETGTIDRTFDLARVKNVRIVTNSMDVRVVPASGGGASDAMRVTGHPSNQHVTVEFERAGDNATLTLRETGDWVYGEMGSTTAQPFTVAFDEHRAIGIESASGDVRVEHARAPLQIESASGDVTVEDASDDVSVRTASGDVVATGLARAADVHTASGEATLALADSWAGKHATVGTMSGDVTLEVPARVRAALQTSTASGDVSNARQLPSSLPGAPVISASTMSGDISIR